MQLPQTAVTVPVLLLSTLFGACGGGARTVHANTSRASDDPRERIAPVWSRVDDGSGAKKRAFEISDLYRIAGAGTPSFSSDGAWIVFSVKRYDVEAGTTWTEIWRMQSDGSEQHRLTSARKADTDPHFSPDGTAILFVSNRSGTSQLWTMPTSGGEPHQLSDFPAGLEGPVYSKDGRWIAAASDVWPECGADPQCHKELEATRAKGKLDVHLADDLLYRHWTDWKGGSVTHVMLVDAASGAVTKDLTPGKFDSPTFDLGGGRGYDFAPDGKHLVYLSNHDANQASSTNADLWLIALDGVIDEHSAVNLTSSNKGWDGAPLYSPDGSKIAFISQEKPAYESDLKRLAVLDLATKNVRYLTQRGGFDDWVDDMRWAPDGLSIVFQSPVAARNPLFRVELASGKIDRVLAHGQIDAWDLAHDGAHIVYARRTVGEPPEIFSAATSGGTPKRLTQLNAALENEVDIRPAEEMWVQGDGPYKVHVFLVKPHGFDPHKRYPLILNVHGGPQSQWTDSLRGDWQVYPAKGYVVAFANPTGSNGYGQDFCDAIGSDYGGRVFRDLMKVTDALEQLPYVDSKRMGSMGWSYGGYMMMWFEGHTQRFACQAAMMGLYDLRSFWGATEELWFPEHDLGGHPWDSEQYERWSPSNSVAKFKTPSLVITGELDFRVPYTQGLQYFSALQTRGVPSRLVVLPNSGHWPGWQEMMFYYDAHLDWFHRWLGGEAAPRDPLDWAKKRGAK